MTCTSDKDVAMFRKTLGFTLIELLVVIALLGVSLTLAIPSWERVSHKRIIANAGEQLTAFLVVAQSEAQKRNQPVSLSFDRRGSQDWCIGAVVGEDGCDCTVNDPGADRFCSIDDTPRRFTAAEFDTVNLVAASDAQPGGGDAQITFDPVRGILQPAGDMLQFTFESTSGDFSLRLRLGPTGLLTICQPPGFSGIGGYPACPG